MRKRLRGPNSAVAMSENMTIASTSSPPWLSNLPIYIPDSMQSPVPKKYPQLIRSIKRLQAQETNYSSYGNNIIAFDFPNTKPLDFHEGYLMMDIKLTKTGGTYIRLAQGAWSVINKFRMVFGSMEDEIQYYNRLYSYIWNSSVEKDVEATIGHDLMGIGTEAERNANGASVSGVSYVIPMLHGFFRSGIIPMNALSTGQNGQLLRVELTLENALMCVETDGINPQIQITNLRWHYTETSSPDGSFERSMFDMVRSGGYKIGFESWTVYQNPVINSAPDVIIQWKGAALNSVVSVLVDSSVSANPAISNKFTTWLKTLGGGATLLSYQHSVNEMWYPVEAIDTSGNAYRAFMEYLVDRGLWDIDGRNLFASPIAVDSFNDNQFMITLNLRSATKKSFDRAEVFNNLTTSTSTSNMLLRMQFSTAPPPQTVIYHFVSNSVLLCASPSGVLVKKW